MNPHETLPARKGWGVALYRKDGTRFLSSMGMGTGRAVWCNSNRKYAVAHKREMLKEGFDARVVPVLFADPVIL